MSLSFSYLLTIFVNLAKQPIKGEIKIINKHEKFLVFLNDTYLEKDYPHLRIQYHSQYTSEALENIENNIFDCNTKMEYKILHLTYVYKCKEKATGRKVHHLDILTKDGAKLYEVLTAIDCLIRGYKIEELEDSIIITTPTNNKRTIRYNQSWHCDCNEYSNYYTCQHIKLANTYLNHRNNFNE